MDIRSILPITKFFKNKNTLGIEDALWNNWLEHSSKFQPKRHIPHREQRKFFRDLFLKFAEQNNIQIPRTSKFVSYTLSDKRRDYNCRRYKEQIGRNKEIFNDYKYSNLSLREIGKKYDMTYERVRQIVQDVEPGFVRAKTYSTHIDDTIITAATRKELIGKVKIYKKQSYFRKRKQEFFINVSSTDDGCWEWIGKRFPTGYGRFYFGFDDRKEIFAHRVSYKLKYGEIPKGLSVLHKCDNPPCVNPKHLKLGTHKENMQDREKRYEGYASPRYRKNIRPPKRIPHWNK